MAIDLHIHSTASDGTVPPEALPALGAAAGLSALALTDHDTVAGVPAFLARQKDHPGLELIAGVELSSHYAMREIHLVGLFLDIGAPALLAFLDAMRAERRLRAEKMREKLAALGYPLDDDELRAAGAHDTPGRPHFARALVRRGAFASVPEVFTRLLQKGAPGYVPRTLPEPADCLRAIKAAGGVAVWAHPVRNHSGEESFARRVLTVLAPLGLDAVEAHYTDFTARQTQIMSKLAGEFRLALSGGSDFHGENHPDIAIGTGSGALRVPDEFLIQLRAKLRPKVVLG